MRSSICNSGYKFPYDRTIINLALADIKKDGTGFDLPIALGILSTTEIVSLENLSKYIVLGELSLDRRIKPVKGTLPTAIKAKNEDYRGIIIPFENRNEAAVIDDISVIPVSHLSEVVDFFRETKL